MKEPSVCCVMLVNGRPEMVKRAIKSFCEQTYSNKRLLIWDTGEIPIPNRGGTDFPIVNHVIFGSRSGLDTVGQLRNEANAICGSADILAHLDSDDWSHPRRLEEQVALLEMTGKECVGYSDMLFFDETPGHFCGAWLWSNLDKRQPIGTSLMYKRSAWERVPFLALPNKAGSTGEEYNFLKRVDAIGVSSIPAYYVENKREPRMIASIHGGNTQYYDPAEYVAHNRGTSWKCAAEWDAHCREVMAL